MLTFGMGASTQALFARVGGGIYTKAADVGHGSRLVRILRFGNCRAWCRRLYSFFDTAMQFKAVIIV